MSDRFGSLRPSWIAFGWFLSAAITALVLLGAFAFELVGPAPSAGGVWISAALLLGFLLGGYIVGWRTGAAPLLHGLGIGLFSLVVWAAVNLLLGEPTGEATWTALPTTSVVALLALQAAAAMVGARIGVRSGRR